MHVLLIVNTYVTSKDPRRGAKFRTHLKTFKQHGIKAGLVAIMQRDFTPLQCLRQCGFVFEEQEYSATIIRDCTYYALLRRLPGLRDAVRAAVLAERSIKRYFHRNGRPDVIHAHGSMWAGVAANTVAARERVPYVLTEHTSHFQRRAVRPQYLPLLRKVFAESAMRLPVSEATGQALEQLFGRSARPWIAIANMVSDEAFAPSLAVAANHDDPVFVTAGRLEPIKNIGLMLYAFAEAFSGGNAQLRICGDGTERSQLERLARSLGIDNQVTFLGWVERQGVAKELARATAYVVSSECESFGIPVIEAHALGKPVIATRCGGPESLIKPENGLLVPVGDPAALAAAMRDVASRSSDFDAAAISAACRERFSPDAVLDRLLRIYEAAIRRAADTVRP